MVLTLLVSITMFAQENENDKRKIFSPEDFKRKMEAFVSKDANLTPYEAQRLFPILHEMFDKQRDINEEKRKIMRNVNDKTSEAEYCQIIERVSDLEIEEKNIEKRYYKKFHNVLSWKKIHNVRRSLVRFNMEALRRYAPPPQFMDKNWNRNNKNNKNNNEKEQQ